MYDECCVISRKTQWVKSSILLSMYCIIMHFETGAYSYWLKKVFLYRVVQSVIVYRAYISYFLELMPTSIR